DAARSGLALELLSGRLRLWTGSGWADVGGATAGVWHQVAVAKSSTLASVWVDGRAVWRGFSPLLGPPPTPPLIRGLLPSPASAASSLSRCRGAIARLEVASGAFRDADVAARYAAEAAPYLHLLSPVTAVPSCLGGTRTCVQVPVMFDRVGTSGVLGFSVTLQ